ncbi:MAG: DUF6067 family protein, partial [Planctomycetota bacterium]|nr:DUF6067 family protein [Planctomycetota bacterium]
MKKLLVPFPKAKTTSERASIPPSTSKLFLLTQADKPGDSLVRVRLDGVDGSLAEALVPARIPDHLGLRVKTFLLTGALEYEVDLRRMRDKLTEAAALQVSVTGPQGPVGRHRHENIKTKEVVRGAFRYQVEPGSIYSVKAKVLDGAKEIAVRGLQTTTASEESFPDWWTMNEGFEPLIPPPWSEVKTNGSKIEILGRTYELTAQALPVRITTRGHSILAGPIRLETSGLWKTGELKQKDSRPDFASYVGTLDRDDLHVQIENRIEFDGFMAITVRIEGFSSLGRLDLVIPFKAEHAKLLQNYYTAPGPAKRVARFTGEIPAGGYKSPPFITTWIGTDHYGLEFSCESSKGWAMAEPQEAMEVTRKGDQVLLTVHFISKPVTVEHRQTRTIRFGLVATPTKTVLPYLKRARFYDDVYVALLPIDWSGFPAWHPPMKDKARIEEKRKWVESVHKRGQKLLVNGGWAISMQDTDNEPWVHEMFKEPKQNVSYSSARQFAYCYRTPYAQF